MRIKKVKGVLEKSEYIAYSRKTYDIVAKDRGKFVLKETSTQEEPSKPSKHISKHIRAHELQYKTDAEEIEPVRPTQQRKGRGLKKVG